MPTELSRERTGFYHAANRALTRADQNIYNTTINSSGLDKDQAQLYKSFVPFTGSQAEVDAWITQNPNFISKQNKVALTELAGSNGQTWFITVNGQRALPFITEQFLVDLTTNTVPNAYVFELYDSVGNRIPPTTGDWWVMPDEGLIRFEAGSTPADMGWGTPQVTCYVGSLSQGDWRVYNDADVFYIDHYHAAAGEWKPHIQILDDNIRMRGTILADLNSFQLGDVHKMSSGGEQIVFENLDLNTIVTPIGSAVTKHLADDYGASGEAYNHPAVKYYDELEMTNWGPPNTSAEMDFEFIAPNTNNSSTFGVEFVPAEDYTGVLTFDRYYSEGAPGEDGYIAEDMHIFRARHPNVVLKKDVPFLWFFDKPSTVLGYEGSPLQKKLWGFLTVQTDREVPLKVRPASVSPTDFEFPSIRIWARSFHYKYTVLSDQPTSVEDGGIGSSSGHGPTEWLFAEESRMDSLHQIDDLALAGKDGGLLVFDPFSDERGAVEFEQYRIDELPTLHEAGTHFALADNSGHSLFFSPQGLHKSSDLFVEANVLDYNSASVDFTYPMTVDRVQTIINGSTCTFNLNNVVEQGGTFRHSGWIDVLDFEDLQHGNDLNDLEVRVFETPASTVPSTRNVTFRGADYVPSYPGTLQYDIKVDISQVGQVLMPTFAHSLLGGTTLVYQARAKPNTEPTEWWQPVYHVSFPPYLYGAGLPMFYLILRPVPAHNSVVNQWAINLSVNNASRQYQTAPAASSSLTQTFQFVWNGSNYVYHIVN